MAKCEKKSIANCLSCPLEKCIEDSQTRADYFKEYQKANKEKIALYQKQYYEENKQSKAYVVRYHDLKKMLFKIRKEIGTNNFEYILSEIEKLNKEKISDVKVQSRKVKENV